MPLRLSLKNESKIPVEIEGFTPAWAADKSLAEIERFEVLRGNEKLPLAELFDVTGDAGDRRFDFEGNLAGVHWIGAGLRDGKIHVHGPAGRHVGSAMRSGSIVIDGDAGDWLGEEMHGGQIHVYGNAGHLVGAACRGAAKGMTGGTILVDGNVGNEVGQIMRRGLIAVGGNAGDMLGGNLLAGTIIVLGQCGNHPGTGMRRGTLALLGSQPPALLPSYRYACRTRPTVLALLLRELAQRSLTVSKELLSTEIDVFNGDLLSLGKGEVFTRPVA